MLAQKRKGECGAVVVNAERGKPHGPLQPLIEEAERVIEEAEHAHCATNWALRSGNKSIRLTGTYWTQTGGSGWRILAHDRSDCSLPSGGERRRKIHAGEKTDRLLGRMSPSMVLENSPSGRFLRPISV